MIKRVILVIFMLTAVNSFMVSHMCSAEKYIIEVEGGFDMGDDDSREYSKKKAVEEALRKATEQAGIYVESYSEVKGEMLTKDEMHMAAASIIRVIDEEIVFETGDNWHCKALIKAEVDTDNVDLQSIINARYNKIKENSGNSISVYQLINQSARKYTGLVVDISHLVQGKMFFTSEGSCIKAEDGEVIYSRNVPVRQNTNMLWLNIFNNRSSNPYFQAGKNPLVVKALFLEENTNGVYENIIISRKDADIIKESNRKIVFWSPDNILLKLRSIL